MYHYHFPKIISAIALGVLPVLMVTTALAAAPTTTKPPAVQNARPIYTWKTDSSKDDKTNQFDHCLVKNMYDNGTVLMLAENREGDQRIALHFPQDKMRTGDKFDLALQVDTSDVFPVEAAAISSRILAIGIPSSLPDQMRKGMSLHIRGPNDEVVYDLDGMDGAVSSLRDCIMVKQREMTQMADASTIAPKDKDVKAEAKKDIPAAMPAPVAVPNPVASTKDAVPPKVVAAPVTAPIANPLAMLEEKKKIDVLDEHALPEHWAKIVAEAQMPKAKLLPIQSARLVQPLDFYWQDNSLSYGIKDLPTKSGELLEKTTQGYLQRMKLQCGKGSFVAEASTLLHSADKKLSWKIAETACSNGKGQDTMTAVLAIATPDRSSIVMVHGDMTKGADSIKARNAILKAITE